MNITKLAALAIAAIVVTGCATTTPRTAQFNPNNKGIQFAQGKPYLVPYGAYTNNAGKLMSSNEIAKLDKLKAPHNCRKGDLAWAEPEYYKTTLSTLTSSMSYEKIADTFRTGFMGQRMGCTSALSATEYDYYKTAQVQRLQQVRHNQNLQMQQNAINAIDQPTSCITNNGFTTCF